MARKTIKAAVRKPETITSAVSAPKFLFLTLKGSGSCNIGGITFEKGRVVKVAQSKAVKLLETGLVVQA